MIQNLDTDFSFVRTADLNKTGSLCDAMGLSSIINPPFSIYTFVAAALPIPNNITSPVADVTTALGAGPGGFNIPLPPPLIDVGTLWTSGSTATARCTLGTDNDIVGLISMAMLEVGYINTNITAARSAIGKKLSTGVTSAGYAIYTLTSNITCKVVFSDGVTQVTIDNLTNYPPGWYSILSTVDRAAGLFSLYTSFGPPVQTAIPGGFGSLSTVTQFRPSGLPTQNQGRTTCLQALWSAIFAEGIVGGNLDSLNQYLNIPVV